MFARDCVAIAPTPASAQGTTEPTAKNFDCTAIPRSPLSASYPTIENVATGREQASLDESESLGSEEPVPCYQSKHARVADLYMIY